MNLPESDPHLHVLVLMRLARRSPFSLSFSPPPCSPLSLSPSCSVSFSLSGCVILCGYFRIGLAVAVRAEIDPDSRAVYKAPQSDVVSEGSMHSDVLQMLPGDVPKHCVLWTAGDIKPTQFLCPWRVRYFCLLTISSCVQAFHVKISATRVRGCACTANNRK